ncbi:hypothetical protein ACJRPK_02475 [Aquimarina sp. 2-A2]|uniref:hypothetical protein n=1 Tax=Aquimarina sp. 2-A2 TaxID=3382644 RepID=UPI00387F33B4
MKDLTKFEEIEIKELINTEGGCFAYDAGLAVRWLLGGGSAMSTISAVAQYGGHYAGGAH